MKSEIIKLRKQIYKYLKDKAYSYEDENQEVSAYLENQKNFARRDFQISRMSQLLEQVEKSHVVYIGDFHTFDQNIRNVLRIINSLSQQDELPVIALEMVENRYQFIIETYMEGQLTELEFLEEINYHNSWKFPWTHYKLIFELAKEKKLKILGLNTIGSLLERDQFASQLIDQELAENPLNKIIVLYGELHISMNKIPLLTKNMRPEVKQTIIHQNLDEVYWQLIEADQEAELVQFSEQEFCLISAPPWVKYESMVYWYENLCNDPEFDIHHYIIENGKKIFSDDTRENFFLICNQIINFLDLSIKESEIEHFNLYDHTNLEFVEDLLVQSVDQRLFSFYEHLIATNRSFRFLDNKFYCSSYSLNRLSYLAGIHILHFYFHKKKLNALSIYQSKDNASFFSLMIYEAMMAYFFSKVINPHRKCDMYLDLYKAQDEVSKLTIKFLESEEKLSNLESLSLETLYEISLNIGHILGEYLYQKFNTKKFNFESLFDQMNFDQTQMIKIKNTILETFDFKSHQKRFF